MIQGLLDFFGTTGFTLLTWKMPVMWAVAGVIGAAVAAGYFLSTPGH